MEGNDSAAPAKKEEKSAAKAAAPNPASSESNKDGYAKKEFEDAPAAKAPAPKPASSGKAVEKPPASKLPMNLAKERAVEANKKQWGIEEPLKP